MNIAANIQSLGKRIFVICKKANIDPEEIKIVGASKYATAEQIREAYDAGVTIFGENKVQDLLKKQQTLKELPIQWHFIGHLQTNKVKKVVGRIKLIHSVDSLRLAAEINRRAAQLNIKQDILVQVNISKESSKGGFQPSESLQNMLEIAKLEAVELRGLMTITPFTNEESVLRKHFSSSKKCFDIFKVELGSDFNILSMGMSNDYEIAIEYGANLLRLGSVIWRDDE